MCAGMSANVVDAFGCTLLHVGVNLIAKHLHVPDTSSALRLADNMIACLQIVLDAGHSASNFACRAGFNPNTDDNLSSR